MCTKVPSTRANRRGTLFMHKALNFGGYQSSQWLQKPDTSTTNNAETLPCMTRLLWQKAVNFVNRCVLNTIYSNHNSHWGFRNEWVYTGNTYNTSSICRVIVGSSMTHPAWWAYWIVLLLPQIRPLSANYQLPLVREPDLWPRRPLPNGDR